MFMTWANLLFMSSNTIFICVTHKSRIVYRFISAFTFIWIFVDPFNGFAAYARNASFPGNKDRLCVCVLSPCEKDMHNVIVVKKFINKNPSRMSTVNKQNILNVAPF